MVGTASKPNDASEPLVRLEGLCVDFRRHAVLREIDLSVARGETVAIIGESGCGKTVLLKTIIALVRPTRGKVVFDGQDLAALGERQLTDQRHAIRFSLPAGGAVRQHDGGGECGLSLASAHVEAAGGDPRHRLFAAGGGGASGGRRGEEAGGAFRGHEEARGVGPGAGHGAGSACSTTSRPPVWTRS